MINRSCLDCIFSFGVFYMELIDYFRQGKGQTALVGSTLMGTHLIFGKFYCLSCFHTEVKRTLTVFLSPSQPVNVNYSLHWAKSKSNGKATLFSDQCAVFFGFMFAFIQCKYTRTRTISTSSFLRLTQINVEMITVHTSI